MTNSTEIIAALRSQISLDAVYQAREVISDRLPRTPLMRHPLLVEALGCEVHLKHENHLPTGSFKIRGGLNYMSHLPESDRNKGVVTATRGNHGQSIALAAQSHGIRCLVVVPHGNNPDKNAAMKAYGAELIEHGVDFDEARGHVEDLVEREGLTYVHSANEPHLINGVGTYSLEIIEDLPDIDTLIVPVGGGSGLSGALTVFKALKPEVEIIGVQAENAPSIFESWKTGGRVITDSADTFADGLATRVPFDLPMEIIREGVDDIVLVSEDSMRDAVLTLLRATHNVAEGAGAASVAAIMSNPERFRGRNVAAVLSGGNIDMATLREILTRKV